MTEEKKINMGIDDGKEFFAHETSINFSPTQVILDFRSITPRVDPRTKDTPYIALRHNVVMVDPWHAKEIQRILSNALSKYEEKFGVIETPKHLKEAANKKEDGDEHKTEIPSYFG